MFEDVFAADAVVGREVDCAVELEDDPPTIARREKVYSDEIGPDGSRGSESDQARLRWERSAVAAAAECDVRPPLARRSDPFDGTDDLACRDKDP